VEIGKAGTVFLCMDNNSRQNEDAMKGVGWTPYPSSSRYSSGYSTGPYSS